MILWQPLSFWILNYFIFNMILSAILQLIFHNLFRTLNYLKK